MPTRILVFKVSSAKRGDSDTSYGSDGKSVGTLDVAPSAAEERKIKTTTEDTYEFDKERAPTRINETGSPLQMMKGQQNDKKIAANDSISAAESKSSDGCRWSKVQETLNAMDDSKRSRAVCCLREAATYAALQALKKVQQQSKHQARVQSDGTKGAAKQLIATAAVTGLSFQSSQDEQQTTAVESHRISTAQGIGINHDAPEPEYKELFAPSNIPLAYEAANGNGDDSSDDDVPISQLLKKHKKQNESSDDDDVPLVQLLKRRKKLKNKAKEPVSTERREHASCKQSPSQSKTSLQAKSSSQERPADEQWYGSGGKEAGAKFSRSLLLEQPAGDNNDGKRKCSADESVFSRVRKSGDGDRPRCLLDMRSCMRRTSYRCGICGQPKADHTCSLPTGFVMVADGGTQTAAQGAKISLQSGVRVVNVRRREVNAHHSIGLNKLPNKSTSRSSHEHREVNMTSDAHWWQRFNELRQYKNIYGHCDVSEVRNPRLGRWVRDQHRLYQRITIGLPSRMTTAHIDSLERIGFEWREDTTVSYYYDAEKIRRDFKRSNSPL